jgi:hypothetical protein
MKSSRKLIAKEIELGFLRVPADLVKQFPADNNKLSCILAGKKKELSYNSKYRRIFGLVGFFRENDAVPNDLVEVDIEDGKVKLVFIRTTKKEKDLSPIDEEGASDIINVSDLSTQAKGNIVEQRIAELILLYGQGLLNVYKPIADIEGIDLVVVKKGIFQPIFIQVKSRFNLRKNNFQIGVKQNNFKPHHSFFVVGAYFDPKRIDIFDYLVFIPTEEFVKRAVLVREGQKEAMYALRCRLSDEGTGRFTEFIVKKENLVNKIFEKFQEIEKYIR